MDKSTTTSNGYIRKNSGTANGGMVSEQDESERLSQDLALFLSDPNLQSALADGSLDLSSYSSTINSELATLERECIELHRRAMPDVRVLRDEMDACDSILAGLHEMLLGFQADLSGLSGDIRQLQDQSRSLAVQVDNRREAEECLRLFLERIVVPPNMAHVICTGEEVDELFLECVKDLEEKYAYVQMTEENLNDPDCSDPGLVSSAGIPPASTVAGKEMVEHLSKLRLRAVDRTRAYFLKVMAQLRRPKTHVRMIQSHALLKYEYLVDFLLVASPTVHSEIRDVYVESMSKTLYTLFRTYHKQLLLLDLRLATRVDLIAVEEAALRDAFSTKVNMRKRGDAFVLGDRAKVLDGAIGAETGGDAATSLTSSPINAHLALMNGDKYSYEMIFRSIMSHLIDAATNEYVFARQFFKEYGQDDCWHSIFGKTLSLVLEQLENYLFNCHDAIAILLMIKLTHYYKRLVKVRRIDKVMESFLDRVTNLFWPRLKMVMDAHLRSIRGANAKKVGAGDIHAHLVSRRYAEFTCSILLILNRGRKSTGENNMNGGGKLSDKPSQRGSAGDMLVNDLDVMAEEMVLLLKRLSDVHPSNKKRIIFMINNLDSIITIFKERRVSGRELNHFSELLVQQRELFVEEELLQTFSKMIAFVQQTEAHMSGVAAPRGARGVAAPADVVNPEVVESLVHEFASNWKAGIEQINRNVLSYFSNFRNGMEILKQVLTQLLLYYTRFQDVIRKVWRGKPPSFCKDLVSTSVILAEIKKHALSI